MLKIAIDARADLEIGRILHLKSEIRNIRLDCLSGELPLRRAADFLGFSYGFRPKRSQHQALDALAQGIWGKWVNWILDCDLRSFFDTLKHDWLVQFLEYRIADQRVIRLIQKWLHAGVLEDGKRDVSKVRTPDVEEFRLSRYSVNCRRGL